MSYGLKVIRLVAFSVMLLSTQLVAQTVSDSLWHEFQQAKDNQDKVTILLQLSSRQDQPEKALAYCKDALDFSFELDDKYLKATSLQQLGYWQVQAGQLDSARINLDKSIRLFEHLGHMKAIARSISHFALLCEELYLLDSARFYYQQAINIADSIHDESGYAIYNLRLGEMENIRGNNKKAISHLEIANHYFDTPARRDSAWVSLNSLAIVFDEMGLYPEALGYYLRAYEIIDDTDNMTGKIIVSNNLGTIYHALGKPKEAREYYTSGLEVAKASDLKMDEAMLLSNTAIIYAEEGDTAQAFVLLQRAHRIQLETGQSKCDLAFTCEGLGEVMVWKKDYDSAAYYYNEALEWAKRCEIRGSQTSIYRNLGLLAKNQGNQRKAENHLLRSFNLGASANYSSELKETAKELFNFYYENNELRNALKYQLIYADLKDSLFNAQSTERIARMTAEYDFRHEIESLEYKKMADELRLNDEIRQKESNQNSILVVLVLTTLLAATLGRSYYLVQNHNKKLTVLNEEKNTLMGVVAHDLRSPLNNMKGLMSLVKMENASLSPEQSHYFHLVDDTMERMRDMIDRVLDVSVVEDMKVNLNLKKVDLGQAMNFVAGNFELLASKKSIQIHADLPVSKHFIFADYNYLLQVIENLLSNAIKFSESGKSIFLNVFQEEDSETMIVRDEGPGISDEDQTRLFNKFQKLSAKPTDNEQSTGLGLSIVKKFVDAMQAEISCESQLGKGTSFIVRFKTAIEEDLLKKT